MPRFGLRARLALLAVPAVVGGGAVVVAVAPSADAASRSVTVRLGPSSFMPKRVVVARGGSVTWRWPGDGIRHNVTWRGSKRPAASSSTRASGTYRVRFTHRGTYRYECTIHAGIGMVGTVVVR